eukprot:scaffold437_cov168-Ochromonas_danica.AAC.56
MTENASVSVSVLEALQGVALVLPAEQERLLKAQEEVRLLLLEAESLSHQRTVVEVVSRPIVSKVRQMQKTLQEEVYGLQRRARGTAPSSSSSSTPAAVTRREPEVRVVSADKPIFISAYAPPRPARVPSSSVGGGGGGVTARAVGASVVLPSRQAGVPREVAALKTRPRPMAPPPAATHSRKKKKTPPPPPTHRYPVPAGEAGSRQWFVQTESELRRLRGQVLRTSQRLEKQRYHSLEAVQAMARGWQEERRWKDGALLQTIDQVVQQVVEEVGHLVDEHDVLALVAELLPNLLAYPPPPPPAATALDYYPLEPFDLLREQLPLPATQSCTTQTESEEVRGTTEEVQNTSEGVQVSLEEHPLPSLIASTSEELAPPPPAPPAPAPGSVLEGRLVDLLQGQQVLLLSLVHKALTPPPPPPAPLPVEEVEEEEVLQVDCGLQTDDLPSLEVQEVAVNTTDPFPPEEKEEEEEQQEEEEDGYRYHTNMGSYLLGGKLPVTVLRERQGLPPAAPPGGGTPPGLRRRASANWLHYVNYLEEVKAPPPPAPAPPAPAPSSEGLELRFLDVVDRVLEMVRPAPPTHYLTAEEVQKAVQTGTREAVEQALAYLHPPPATATATTAPATTSTAPQPPRHKLPAGPGVQGVVEVEEVRRATAHSERQRCYLALSEERRDSSTLSDSRDSSFLYSPTRYLPSSSCSSSSSSLSHPSSSSCSSSFVGASPAKSSSVEGVSRRVSEESEGLLAFPSCPPPLHSALLGLRATEAVAGEAWGQRQEEEEERSVATSYSSVASGSTKSSFSSRRGWKERSAALRRLNAKTLPSSSCSSSSVTTSISTSASSSSSSASQGRDSVVSNGSGSGSGSSRRRRHRYAQAEDEEEDEGSLYSFSLSGGSAPSLQEEEEQQQEEEVSVSSTGSSVQRLQSLRLPLLALRKG